MIKERTIPERADLIAAALEAQGVTLVNGQAAGGRYSVDPETVDPQKLERRIGYLVDMDGAVIRVNAGLPSPDFFDLVNRYAADWAHPALIPLGVTEGPAGTETAAIINLEVTPAILFLDLDTDALAAAALGLAVWWGAEGDMEIVVINPGRDPLIRMLRDLPAVTHYAEDCKIGVALKTVHDALKMAAFLGFSCKTPVIVVEDLEALDREARLRLTEIMSLGREYDLEVYTIARSPHPIFPRMEDPPLSFDVMITPAGVDQYLAILGDGETDFYFTPPAINRPDMRLIVDHLKS